MVYAVTCPLSHGFCALGELGKVSPTLNPGVCVCQIGDQSTTVIWHDMHVFFGVTKMASGQGKVR